jgi:potassium-dependent mechanosensitive channel
MTTLQRATTPFLILHAVLLMAALLACVSSASAQPTPSSPPGPSPQSALPPEIVASLSKTTASLTEAEKALQQLSGFEDELGSLRTKVEDVLDQTSQTAESLRPQLEAVKSQIEKLGPAPAKDAPPEAPEVAGERTRLTALSSAYDGAIKSSEVTWVRARQLIERITVLRHSLFTKNLLERLPSPLLPGIWRDIVTDAPVVRHRIGSWVENWSYWAARKQGELSLLAAVVLFVYIFLKLVVARRTRRRTLRAEPPLPTFFERAISVSWVAPLRALPAAAASLLLYGGLDTLELLYNPWGRAAFGILKGLLVYVTVSALLYAVMAPRAPQWRLVPLADRPARRVARLLSAITAVYALDGALTEVARAFFVPLTLSVVQSFATSIAFASLLIGLLLTPFTPQTATESQLTVSRHEPRWLKVPLWIIAIGIVVASLLGYVALARFAAQQLVLTGIVVLLGWLGYLAIRAVTREPPQRGLPVGDLLEQRFGLDASRRHQLTRLTELALTFALVICALPFLMLQWGFSGDDIRESFKALFFGLEIGQFKISLARILLGIVLFIALLFATRVFQRWLRERSVQSRLDPSIANSVDTVVGYIGVALAALLSVSYAGLDITNLAIVAGALSVGIGFGLQSIVNNFVSGLILLIERPIKVGDRVVVGDQQGLVRRISVRATEIETLDRASLIVPNSELITGRVLNWTHRDSLGAVNVKVGVGYNSDPEQVIAILLKCAEDNPDVLRTPAPGAALESFGDSALVFNLRVSLPDIDKAGTVQSDLRVAIFKALGAAGIEIPFNQIDVNLRDLETIKAYLAALLEQPSNGAARQGRPHIAAGSQPAKSSDES